MKLLKTFYWDKLVKAVWKFAVCQECLLPCPGPQAFPRWLQLSHVQRSASPHLTPWHPAHAPLLGLQLFRRPAWPCSEMCSLGVGFVTPGNSSAWKVAGSCEFCWPRAGPRSSQPGGLPAARLTRCEAQDTRCLRNS